MFESMETIQTSDLSNFALDMVTPLNINTHRNEVEKQNQDAEAGLQKTLLEVTDITIRGTNEQDSEKNIVSENLSLNCLSKEITRSEENDANEQERLCDTQTILLENQHDEFNSESLLVPKEVGSSVDVQCHQLGRDIQEDLHEIASSQDDVKNSIPENISISKKQLLDDILRHIRKLGSSEYILLYLQLPKKCIEENTQLTDGTLRSTMENSGRDISDRNKKIMKIITRSLSYDSITKVAAIVERIKDITLPEYSWLQCNLPTDCVNPNMEHCLLPCNLDTSQCILWLKTHFEENPHYIIRKHDVQNKYEKHCLKLTITPLSTSRFGRLLRQVFPGVDYTRRKLNGGKISFYTGIQFRSRLKQPRLAALSKKPQDLLRRYKQYINESTAKEITVVMDSSDYNNDSNLFIDSDTKISSKPLVYVDKDEVGQWYKERIINYITRLSRIVVTQPNHLENCGLTFICCKDDFEISHTYAKQLNNLKEKLSQLIVRSFDDQTKSKILKFINNDKPINKRTNVQEANIDKHIHPTIQKLHKKFEHLTLPSEVLFKNVDPAVILNSGEVTNWYINEINHLKGRLEMCKDNKDRKLRNSAIEKVQVEDFVEENRPADDRCESDNLVFNYKAMSTTLRTYNGPRRENEDNNRNPLKRPFKIISSDILISEYANEPKRFKVDEESHDLQRKQRYNNIIPNTEMVLQSFLSNTNEENTNNANMLTVNENSMCPMCDQLFNNNQEFLKHQKSHLTCNTCRRKLSNINSMREHLKNHCYLNGTNKPILMLTRIDSVPEIVSKYKNAFTFSKNKMDNHQPYLIGNKRPDSSENTFKTDNIDTNPNFMLSNLNDSAQLQQSINANLNKILLLSNHQQPQSQPIITFYLNNLNAQSSNCKLHPASVLNATCINSDKTSGSFPQIVEQLSTSAATNGTSISVAEQLQDHSYHQQIQMKIENDSLCDSNSAPDTSLESSETVTLNNCSKNNNLSDKQETSGRQGQFRIRVKSIQELR